MCPGFACLLECNAKFYVLVTVWEMIVYVYISMAGTKIQSEVMLVPPMVYRYFLYSFIVNDSLISDIHLHLKKQCVRIKNIDNICCKYCFYTLHGMMDR
jgi:hypothetical protein